MSLKVSYSREYTQLPVPNKTLTGYVDKDNTIIYTACYSVKTTPQGKYTVDLEINEDNIETGKQLVTVL